MIPLRISIPINKNADLTNLSNVMRSAETIEFLGEEFNDDGTRIIYTLGFHSAADKYTFLRIVKGIMGSQLRIEPD